MNTIKNIQNYILNWCETATITPTCNGGIQVNVEDEQELPAIISAVANALYEYQLEDVRIATNQAQKEIYISLCD